MSKRKPVEGKQLIIEYEITRIRVLEYVCNAPPANSSGEQPLKTELAMTHSVPLDAKSIEIRTKIDVCRDEGENQLLFSISTLCSFSLKGHEDAIFSNKENDKQQALALPESLLLRLSNIAVGTTRGILASKNTFTPYDTVILPVVPDKMISIKPTVGEFILLPVGLLNWPPKKDEQAQVENPA